jgi:putative FmdB family regulatory protein
MPIYEYTCSACGRRTDILHGINEAAPAFCPECGAEGTLRKAFAPPAIVFKGSGWAKKDRSSSGSSGSKSSRSSSDTDSGSSKPATDSGSAGSGSGAGTGAGSSGSATSSSTSTGD